MWIIYWYYSIHQYSIHQLPLLFMTHKQPREIILVGALCSFAYIVQIVPLSQLKLTLKSVCWGRSEFAELSMTAAILKKLSMSVFWRIFGEKTLYVPIFGQKTLIAHFLLVWGRFRLNLQLRVAYHHTFCENFQDQKRPISIVQETKGAV